MSLFFKNKSDVSPTFKSFHKMVRTQFDAKLRILQSDIGHQTFFWIINLMPNFESFNLILELSTCLAVFLFNLMNPAYYLPNHLPKHTEIE